MRGNMLQAKLFDRGLHVKSTGDAAIIAPALIATRADIDQIAGVLREVLAEC
jgi:beta-alanine--pyruvate transaminase